MPADAVSIEINSPSEQIFDLVHDYDRRLEWDPFLRKAELLGEASEAGTGVSSRCVARWAAGGMGMDTIYVTFKRPSVAAVSMTRGPWFIRSFAASIRHECLGEWTVRVTYRYYFRTRPQSLRWLLDPIVQTVLRRETARRLAALKRHLERSPASSAKSAEQSQQIGV